MSQKMKFFGNLEKSSIFPSKIGIIGKGLIGSELYRKAKALNWDVRFVLDIDGVYKNLTEKIDSPENYQSYCKDINIVFLAIPTLDNGKTAFNYMNSLLEKNIPVVTCEKGALSNYFSELKKFKDKIGYSATAGGGSGMLNFLEKNKKFGIREIHAVVNGTLNYILDGISKGDNLNEMVDKAKQLGYAEPNAKTSLDIINKEATEDIPMKSSILFNIFNPASKYMKAVDIKSHKINDDGLMKLIEECKNRRYIVSISKENREEDVIDGFKYQIDDWIVSAGFKRIDENPLYSRLVYGGVTNAIVIIDNKNKSYEINGPGAGADPTTASMIKDAIELTERLKNK